MSQYRHISVWLLLVTIVVGGVVGPVLHRVQHGAAQIADRPETPCHTAGVHNAETPLWTEAASDLHAPACDLCATRLLVVPPTPGPTMGPHRRGTTRVAPRSHLAAVHVSADQFIRGPPTLSEARLS